MSDPTEADRVLLLVAVAAAVEARGGAPWQCDAVVAYLDNEHNWTWAPKPMTPQVAAMILDNALTSAGLARRSP